MFDFNVEKKPTVRLRRDWIQLIVAQLTFRLYPARLNMVSWKIMNQPSGKRTPNLFVISLLNFISFLDTTLLIPIIALYATTLDIGPGTVGFIIGLYSILNSPVNIISGRLIDRVGYRLPLLTSTTRTRCDRLRAPLPRRGSGCASPC